MSNKEFKIGDVLYNSWGYDQTNVSFFEVVGLVGKASIEIRPIASDVVEGSEGFMSESVVPVPGSFSDDCPVMRKRVDKWGAVDIYKASYGRARKWDGRPKYSSHYA